MKSKSLLVISGLLLAAVLIAVFFINSSRLDLAETKLVEEESNPTPAEEVINRNQPEAVVNDFINNLILAAPPQSNEEALNKAVSFLSEGAKKGMAKEPTAGDLAVWLGVQDLPDQGFAVSEADYKDNQASGIENGLAEVKTLLNYSGGDVEKLFLLSKVDDTWQIDGVEEL